ncbi:Transcriptional coactivator [Klebsormidium nitens]|uniref:Mediator of RNA polymerase II transcription subunit 7 n=1 Tax=Klebsormidium nitens TaxID=105231 RepID=A0A1Y1HQA3_KLENI|nr:Transcriptional coactivator [Klebsormidium nitens]|eukprot:GAQ78766.1 Transcriptional coactivator [Klebsormidium nitens]
MASTYPPPPPYFKLFSDGYKGEQILPPPPLDGTFTMFGQTYSTEDQLPNLEQQGIRQLYPKHSDIDIPAELRKLNRELVFTYLELVDVLAERPSQYARRVEDIGLILKNMHHLLNLLRPHQAQATVLHALEEQVRRRKEALATIRKQRQEMAAALAEGASLLAEANQELLQKIGASNQPEGLR